jgi:manganese/iron transport system permease protein
VDWLTEPFEPEFMQRAVAAGLLAATAAAVVGTWMVIRGLTFMGDALAHGVLPGIAIASLLGVSLTLGAAVSAAVMVAGVAVVSRRSRLPDDVGIGLLFVGMLALAVIVISRSDSFASDLTGFLFGEILAVDSADLWLQAVVTVASVGAVVIGHRAFLALALDPDRAELLDLHPRRAHLALLALIAATVVASFQAVGALLVFGLLVGPPATASLLVRRVPAMMLVAVALGAVAVVGGLVTSWHADTAAGATIAGWAVAQFFVVLALTELSALTTRRAPA